MFTNIVKDLYVGKSKLNIRFQGQAIKPETVIDILGVPYPKLKKYPTYPDYVIIGNFDGKDIFDIKLGTNNHALLITGIPKGAKTLDWYRVKEAIWSSYYEDNYRGYLFQVQDATKKVTLKSYPLETIKD